MTRDFLKEAFKNHSENRLEHRYICNDHILPILQDLDSIFTCVEIGKSVNGEQIFTINFGSGSKRILMWSQMHGNESTTTKSIFDLCNTISSRKESFQGILDNCQITIIPILNPDGARVYTRVNANGIDLNRDAKDLSQPESKILRTVFEKFQPHYCFNLHGQRTIFSVTEDVNSATLSFLSPAEDKLQSVTPNRKVGMALIAKINRYLQPELPNQIGRYDDTYNENCVGDTFQGLSVPTVLFEAGHCKDDYARDITRQFIFESLCVALQGIAEESYDMEDYQDYFNIPENEKLRCDIVLRNAKVNGRLVDIAVQYQEYLKEEKVEFSPKIITIGLNKYIRGHKELDLKGGDVRTHENLPIHESYENDFVLMNNKKFTLKP